MNLAVPPLAIKPDGSVDFSGNQSLAGFDLSEVGLLNFQDATELTISSGAITITQTLHRVDTEADAASDDLDTINVGVGAGDFVILYPENSGRSVVLKHGTGNIVTPSGADFTIAANGLAVLVSDGTNWRLTGSGGIDNVVEDTSPQLGADLDAQNFDVTDLGRLNWSAATELTISSGAITITRSFHRVDTESDAATDDLDTINGGTDGDVIFLYPEAAARQVTLRHAVGNIVTPAALDWELPDNAVAVLAYDGSNWRLVNTDAGGLANVVEDTTPQLGGDLDCQGQDLTDLGRLNLNDSTELTISSGAITVSQSFHRIDGEGDASDDLDTINGGTHGDVIWLYPENAARDITLKHATGNIVTPDGADFTMPDNSVAELVYDGTNWRLQKSAGLAEIVDDTSPQLGADLDAQDFDVTDLARLNLSAATELTISSGAITITQSYHTVDGEGDASDNLDTINGGTAGDLIWLLPEHSARDITLRHGAGNILTPTGADYTIPDDGMVQLLYDGTNWHVLQTPGSSGTGDVTGPASATDNALARFDGTGGKNLQNSGVTLDDNDVLKTKATHSDLVTAADGATVTFDLQEGNWQQVTLGGNRTLALSNENGNQRFVLILKQDATGSRTVTWFSGITWAGGSAPTLTTTANKADMLGFVRTAAGAYYGMVIDQNF